MCQPCCPFVPRPICHEVDAGASGILDQTRGEVLIRQGATAQCTRPRGKQHRVFVSPRGFWRGTRPLCRQNSMVLPGLDRVSLLSYRSCPLSKTLTSGQRRAGRPQACHPVHARSGSVAQDPGGWRASNTTASLCQHQVPCICLPNASARQEQPQTGPKGPSTRVSLGT